MFGESRPIVDGRILSAGQLLHNYLFYLSLILGTISGLVDPQWAESMPACCSPPSPFISQGYSPVYYMKGAVPFSRALAISRALERAVKCNCSPEPPLLLAHVCLYLKNNSPVSTASKSEDWSSSSLSHHPHTILAHLLSTSINN